jgi:ATP-dependent Clp protease ATP-binding subunit ClpA
MDLLEEAMKISSNLGDKYCRPAHFIIAVLLAAENDKTLEDLMDRVFTEIPPDQDMFETVCSSLGYNPGKVREAAKASPFKAKTMVSTDLLSAINALKGDIANAETLFIQCLLISPVDEDLFRVPVLDQSSPAPQGSAISTSSGEVRFTEDLVSMAEAGELDPVIGRHDVIRNIEDVLRKRTKNNPVLIGPPGVGKTAIVEAIAQRMASKTTHPSLLNKRILMLDMTGLMAGTTLRGQFEERLKNIINLFENDLHAILFIDEAHMMVGAGSSGMDHGMDMANMLKPALSRRKLQVIAATTKDEYERIAADGALERRFQPVYVTEPTPSESRDILNGIKSIYEKFHSVKVDVDVVNEVVRLADAHIHDRRRPDKNIDLLDESCVAATRRMQSQDAAQDIVDELEELRGQFTTDVLTKGPAEAAPLVRKMELLKEKVLKVKETAATTPNVSLSDVHTAIYHRVGSRYAMYDKSSKDSMNAIIESINSKVVGQSAAVKKLVETMRSGHALARSPIGAVLLTGPTGSGKSEIATLLGEEAFRNVVPLDGEDYQDGTRYNDLIGSPRGYIDSKKGGVITSALRHMPNSFILFENVDKAHPLVLSIVTSMILKGKVDDGIGRPAYLKDAMVVLTASSTSSLARGIGFKPRRGAAGQAAPKNLPAGLVPLLTKIRLAPITKAEAPNIAEEHLRRLSKRIGREITYTDDVLKEICKGFKEEYGARSVVSAIQEKVEPVIADNPGDHPVHLQITRDRLVCRKGEILDVKTESDHQLVHAPKASDHDGAA